MTEVGPTDLSRLLQSKRNEFSSIVTGRKRKLRELFAVATHADALPQESIANLDAPTPNSPDWTFLQSSDILQGRHFNEQTLPPRSTKQPLDILRRTLLEAVEATVKNLPPPTPSAQTQPPPQATRNPGARSHASPKADATDSGRQQKPAPPASSSATPVPLPRQPQFSNAKPNGPVHPEAKHDDERTQDGSPLPQAKGPGLSNRPLQVTFPPGTKGSPSTGSSSTPDAPAGARGALENPDAPVSGDTHRTASVKSSIDSSRMTDAPSSPGSSAPSATPPAIHDASTDTSPEHEGPQSPEDVERKGVDPERGSETIDTFEEDVGGNAEEQLIQESIRSSTAAEACSTPGDTRSVVPNEQSTETQDQRDTTEVADSQDEVLDAMEVDAMDTSVDQSAHILSPREPNAQTPSDRPLPHSTKSESKDQSQIPERAVTRVSSGAMRLKSVSEIVGVAPRPGHLTADRSSLPTLMTSDNQLTPMTSTPQSPAARSRGHRRDRSGSRVSTVLFGKQPRRVEERSLAPANKEAFQPLDDYFTPLFLQGYASGNSWMQTLDKILFHANKTVGTPDINKAVLDHQSCKVLRRVYQMQQQDKWTLRQPKRSVEPSRPGSQWDVALKEMAWMRTDFRKERKWKRTAARLLSHACVEWHHASPAERKALQVVVTIPQQQPTEEMAVADGEEAGVTSQQTPDLISSGDVDSPQNFDELTEDFAETVSPSAIFALQEDGLVFGLRRSPTSDRLLDQLPLYGTPLKAPCHDLLAHEPDYDAQWRRPALPLSRYVESPMVLKEVGPPRKRGRFSYRREDAEEDPDDAFDSEPSMMHVALSPETRDVALFNPETKHIRDRLHAGHQFRPPSEHPMPAQTFYECRVSSQWTVSEDDELRGLVRDYSYNWSLISNLLLSKSLNMSGAERRTPWECFERWVSLEGLPADMQKTQYFKAYTARIDAAQRVIAQHNALAAQQAAATGATVVPPRRRQSTPLRVERRRNNKHLTMIDAMRKLAKKRETTLQKHQHNAAQSAAAKKPNDAGPQRPTKTPREYSQLRYERDAALAEKMAAYAQRQEAQRRQAIMQARAQGQHPQVTAAQAAAGQANPNGQANAAQANGAMPRPPSSSQMAAAGVNGQNRPRATPNGMPQTPAGQQINGAMAAHPQITGAAQNAAMQAMQGQHRTGVANQQTNANIMLRAQQLSDQQRVTVQMQQAQQQHLPPHLQQIQQQQGQQQQLQQQSPHQQPQQIMAQQQPHTQQQQQQQSQQANGVNVNGLQGQHGSPPAMRNGINGVGNLNGASLMGSNTQALMQHYAMNMHAASPGANGMHLAAMGAGTPSPRTQQTQQQQNLVATVSQLEASFRAKNPNISPQDARSLAMEHLTRTMMAQRQAATAAAAGGNTQTGLANGATTGPHQYAALLRQQQQAQQQQAQQQYQGVHPQQALARQQASPHMTTPQVQQASSASPAQSHQRLSSGSATPSGTQ